LKTTKKQWTNASVLALAGDGDPVQVITQMARAAVLDATDAGWSGPPFDPFILAELRHIEMMPTQEVLDARTVPLASDKLQIQFNPNRPPSRVRYSICHELAHTLFPDCRDMIRNRATHEDMRGDDWQLELLCNVGAAELLMPIGSFNDLDAGSVNIDALLRLRQKLQVSTEALMLRVMRLTRESCCLLSFSRRQPDRSTEYHLDYAVPSMNWHESVPSDWSGPPEVVGECTAIGWTAKGHLQGLPGLGSVPVECVGIPPYPGEVYPRVLTLVASPNAGTSVKPQVRRLLGDATEPRGDGKRVIAQIVNDKAPTWGAGFALAVRKKWPHVQEDFRAWAGAGRSRLSLGNSHLSRVDGNVSVFSMVAQHGYGLSSKPRIRYSALVAGLEELANVSREMCASVHMPKIGCGEAGGEWRIIEELITESLSRQGLQTAVYELPEDRDRDRDRNKQRQLSIFGEDT
jgi:hypothetical protein